MSDEQLANDPRGPDHKNLMAGAWRNARVQIAAALAAHGVASVLTVLVSPVPLLTAIAATLTFVGTWMYGNQRLNTNTCPVSPSALLNLYDSAYKAAGVLFGAWVITNIVGDASAFYCVPAMPWRLDIALFGSFVIGLLTKIVHVRGHAQVIYPLTLVALLWVAPYYGYFSGAIFLGISLIVGCADRSVFQLGLVALGMATGNALGSMLAGCLLKPPDDRDT